MKNKKNLFVKALVVLIIFLSGFQSGYSQGSGSAFYFAGNKPHLICDSLSPAPINFSSQTIEAWIKLNSGCTGKKAIFSNGTDYNVLVSDSAGSYYIGYWLKAGGAWLKQKSKTPLKPDTWYHIGAAYDGYSISIFLNGNLDNQKNVGNTSYHSLSPTNKNYIGKSPDTQFGNFQGCIDEVRMWSCTVSQSEIFYWKSMPVTNKHPNWNKLERYYKCDDTGVDVAPPAFFCNVLEAKNNSRACSYDVKAYYYPQNSVYKKSSFSYGDEGFSGYVSPKTVGVFFNNKIHQFSSHDGDPYVRSYTGTLDDQNNVVMSNSAIRAGHQYEIPGACCIYKDHLAYVSMDNLDEVPGTSHLTTLYHCMGTLANDGNINEDWVSRTMYTCVPPAYAVLNDTLYFFYIINKNNVVQLDADWSVDGKNWTFLRTVTTGTGGLDYYFGNVAACTSRDIDGKEVIYVGCVDKAHTAIQLTRFYKNKSVTEAFIGVPKVRNFSMVPGTVEGGMSNGTPLQLFYSADTPDKYGNSKTIGRIEYSIDNKYAYAPEQLPISGYDPNNGGLQHRLFLPYAFSYYKTYGSSKETSGQKIILSVQNNSSNKTQVYLCWNSDKLTYLPGADVIDTNPGDKLSHLLGVIEGPPPFVLNGEDLGELIRYQTYPSLLEFGSTSSQSNENSVSVDKSWSLSFRYDGIGGDFEHHAESTTQTEYSSKTYESRSLFPVEGRDRGYLVFLRPVITRKKYQLTDANNHLLDYVYSLEISDRFIDYVPYYLDTVAHAPVPKHLTSYLNRSVDPGSYKKIYSSNYSWTGGTKSTIGFETDSSVTKSTSEEFYKGAGLTVSIDMGFGEIVDVSTNVFDFESRIGTTTKHDGSTTLGNSRGIAVNTDCPFHGAAGDTSHFAATVYWIKPTDGKNNWWIPKGYEKHKPWCITYKVNSFSLHATSVEDNDAGSTAGSVNIYPNPASNTVSVSFSGSDFPNLSITLSNSLGMVVKRFSEQELSGKNSINFSTEEFPVGVYYCTLNSRMNIIKKSFVVVR
jgi:hypothetical protein